MSSNTNGIPPFLDGTTKDALDAIGITQFPSATEWNQVLGGLVFQGGYVEVDSSAVLAINFSTPYEKQTLGVWIQTVGAAHNSAHISSPTLESFEIHNGAGVRQYYWLSLGV